MTERHLPWFPAALVCSCGWVVCFDNLTFIGFKESISKGKQRFRCLNTGCEYYERTFEININTAAATEVK